jgi:dienelactone hydrolase
MVFSRFPRPLLRIVGALGVCGVLLALVEFELPQLLPEARAHAGQRGCVSANASFSALVHQFDYDTHESLHIQEVGVTQQEGASIHDITYVSQGQTVSAYLVTPAGQGPFAAALFVHWLDNAPTANRTEFLQEAVKLAQKGVVSLLPQGLYPWIEAPQGIGHDCAATILQTIVFRRGLDLLLANKTVDRQRVAFVGHDYGAMYGAILSGVEKRFTAFDLMAPTARFSNWNVPFFLDTLTPQQRLDYTVATAAIDPMNYVGHAERPIFFQYARQDVFVSLADVNNLLEVTGETATFKVYQADHSLTDGLSQQDRLTWLSGQLGLE